MCSNSRPMAAKSILPIGFRVKFTDQWGAPKRMMSIQPLSFPITDIPESVSNVCKNSCTYIIRKYSIYSMCTVKGVGCCIIRGLDRLAHPRFSGTLASGVDQVCRFPDLTNPFYAFVFGCLGFRVWGLGFQM